ncbi:hypothetical protein CYMTET_42891 [Cymbomonas tetramitiformis]|uniref:EF-hand domain-containing protein n=1 Tax=Cymbomonas tetramitiformis TaxID=36881 RepID=A0AAE0F269_9CHLO|nr:hypothetical protein CYMTET_42891 [Cymbomonas tetramitiformis]
MPMSEHDIEACRRSYRQLDRDGSGVLDAAELKGLLQELGNTRTEEEVRLMIQQVDESAKGEINFADYLKIVETNKAQRYDTEDVETFEAWQALGGCRDMSGRVEVSKITGLISDFGLCMDEELTKVVDPDGYISYEKFKDLLSDMALS